MSRRKNTDDEYQRQMASMKEFDCVVVGTGWNGLISAKTFIKLVPNARVLVIDESPSIGGVWSRERIYPSLYAQVGLGLFEYSSTPMKGDGITGDRYIPGKTIHEYLTTFAEQNGLSEHIRLNTTVQRVSKDSTGSWTLELDDLSFIKCSKLIWAGGATSGPFMPAIPRNGFDRKVIHSSEIGANLELLHDPAVKRVTIIGAAKSAYDTMFTFAKAGKTVDWIIRDNGSGPLAIMPPKLPGGFNTIDVMCTRAMAAFSPSILATTGLLHGFLHRSPLGRFIVWMFWSFVNWIAGWHADYGRTTNASKLQPEPLGYGVFWANSGLGLASVPDFWKVFHASDVNVRRTEVKSFSAGNVVTLKDSDSYETDLVIMCTGWTHNLGPFTEKIRSTYNLPSKLDLGDRWATLDSRADAEVDAALPILKNPPQMQSVGSLTRPWRLYRCLVSPDMADTGDRSVFFPGQIHSPFTPVMAEIQALWGVAFMLGMLELPSKTQMLQDVSKWNAWTKKRYLEQGKKHSYSIYDFLAYIDTLIRDLGLNPSRKRSSLSEWFQPYRPADYRGIMDEFLALHAKRPAPLISAGGKSDELLKK